MWGMLKVLSLLQYRNEKALSSVLNEAAEFEEV